MKADGCALIFTGPCFILLLLMSVTNNEVSDVMIGFVGPFVQSSIQ
jgi:hypothetical protein